MIVRIVRSHLAFPIALISLAIAIAYGNSLTGVAVFDDRLSIVENATIRELSHLERVLTPPVEAGVGGRPLTNLSFALNYALSRSDTWSYHLGNITLHALSAFFLLGILRRTFSSGLVQMRGMNDVTGLSAFIAAAWAVLPINTQAVTYLSQRAEVLMGTFYLGAIYAFIRGAKTGSVGWQVIAVVSTLCALLSKEVAVTAPLMMLLYDRTFLAGSFANAWRSRRAFYLSVFATWLALLLPLASLSGRGVGFGLDVSPFEYAITQCRGFWTYLARTFWPEPLIFDYGPIPFPVTANIFPAVLATLAVLGWVIWLVWRRPFPGFGAAWVLVVLCPSSSVVPIVHQPIAESRMYLPSIGLIALAAIGLGVCIATTRLRRIAYFLIVLAACAITVDRNRDYQSEARLWSDTIAKAPTNYRAYYNLGVVLDRGGNLPDAIKLYEEALKLAPAYVEAHSNLGQALHKSDRLGEAEKHLRMAIQFRPDFEGAHINLGNLLQHQGRTQEATEHFNDALRINPRSAEAYNNVGTLLESQGRDDAARDAFRRALALEPRLAVVHYNLGTNLLRSGMLAEAIGILETAIQLKPTDPRARENLGIALLQTNRLEDALAHLEEAVRLAPSSASHNNLSVALSRMGQIEAAIKHCEAAIRLDASNKAAIANLHKLRGTPPDARREP